MRADLIFHSKSDRSRQELSNEYLLTKFGFDTTENFFDDLSGIRTAPRTSQPAENESVKVCLPVISLLI